MEHQGRGVCLASIFFCCLFFFKPWKQQHKVHRGGFIRASSECYQKHGGGQIEDAPIKSHTPTPPCAFSRACCPPLDPIPSFSLPLNIDGAIQNLHAVSAPHTHTTARRNKGATKALGTSSALGAQGFLSARGRADGVHRCPMVSYKVLFN